ncbi:hypothetical protein [Curtobacterium sp. L1-20]|uniref:hypothetical protein n=1 Tax=Curtobacterium sp. L1-20 TaxID=3138181 RepID=UPI003B523431
MTRTRLQDWLWHNQMRQLPRAIVDLVWVSAAAIGMGLVVFVVVPLVRGAW